jgi:hypothetical protein
MDEIALHAAALGHDCGLLCAVCLCVAGSLACCCWIAPTRCTACRQQTEHSPSQPRGRAPREEPAAAGRARENTVRVRPDPSAE